MRPCLPRCGWLMCVAKDLHQGSRWGHLNTATYGCQETLQFTDNMGWLVKMYRAWARPHVKHLQTATANPSYVQCWEDVEAEESFDPFALVKAELNVISERLRASVLSSVPALEQAADYFFRQGVEGKRLRPSLLLLMASALSDSTPSQEFLTVDHRPAHVHPPEMRRQQQRIAEIAEMIHVASLLHDDVIDEADTRRGILSLNANFGNKLAILAGDFLLSRASVSLASLYTTEIVTLLSRVLEHLVTGEVMQMTASGEQLMSLEFYLQKTYCKTASLMANSSQSIAILGNQPPEVCHLAWSYGRHLGLAFQIIDDILDLTATSSLLGKPALNDLASGVATAPILYAAEEHPELWHMVTRRFRHKHDIADTMALVKASRGLQKAKELAASHAHMAADLIQHLPPAQSDHAAISREALIQIADKVITRQA